jgi:hypothetical protein
MLGMGERTLSTRESEGRVTCGQVVPVPGRPGTVKIYPIEALQRLAKEFQATRELKASEPFPPRICRWWKGSIGTGRRKATVTARA